MCWLKNLRVSVFKDYTQKTILFDYNKIKLDFEVNIKII